MLEKNNKNENYKSIVIIENFRLLQMDKKN